jgi:hypothetical protein
MVAIDKFSK